MKAISQTIGKNPRTIDKYLKILQDEDVIYGNTLDGMYDVQSWVFGDYNKPTTKKVRIQQQQTTINNNNSWSRI
jgi:hypothetical protein